jgi:hypothetical protein
LVDWRLVDRVSLAVVTLAAVLLTAAACRTPPEPAPQTAKTETVWRELGSWTGSGARQTESFLSETGMLRLRWQAGPTPDASTGRTFRATVHSAISGRALATVVEHEGPGGDIAFLREDPRSFFLTIEANGLEWSVSVDEGVTGQIELKR